jgi:hypothetical protein
MHYEMPKFYAATEKSKNSAFPYEGRPVFAAVGFRFCRNETLRFKPSAVTKLAPAGLGMKHT